MHKIEQLTYKMKSSKPLEIIQWLLVVAAYGYLTYRLVIYDDWGSLAEHFRGAGTLQYICLAGAVVLFPLNILFESMKWRYLMSDIEKMSLAEAQRQTYFGVIGAFLTPGRLGDFPARVTMMQNKSRWAEAVMLGFIGTLALGFVQVLLGLPSFISLIDRVGGMDWVEWFCVAIFAIQIILIIIYPNLARKWAEKTSEGKWHDTLVAIGNFSHKRFAVTIFYSMLRYAVYCFQLWLVLIFCGIELSAIEALVAIPAYYLLVTVTPSVPVADAAIRGSWSVVIFSVFTDDIAQIAIAAILLWLLNTILPMIVGTFLRKNGHNIEEKSK